MADSEAIDMDDLPYHLAGVEQDDVAENEASETETASVATEVEMVDNPATVLTTQPSTDSVIDHVEIEPHVARSVL
jgi:hypothetical protein